MRTHDDLKKILVFQKNESDNLQQYNPFFCIERISQIHPRTFWSPVCAYTLRVTGSSSSDLREVHSLECAMSSKNDWPTALVEFTSKICLRGCAFCLATFHATGEQTKSFGSARIQTLTHSPWDIAAQSCNNWHCGNTIPGNEEKITIRADLQKRGPPGSPEKKQQGRVNHLAFHSWTNQHRAQPTELTQLCRFSVGLPVLAGLCDPPNGLGQQGQKTWIIQTWQKVPSKDWSLKNDDNDSPLIPFSDSRIFKIVQGTVPKNPTFLKERGFAREQSVPLSY